MDSTACILIECTLKKIFMRLIFIVELFYYSNQKNVSELEENM